MSSSAIPSSKSRLIRFAPVFMLTVALFVGCSAAPEQQKAPPFTLVDLKGKSFSLADFKGKVVLLDFWATWCPPCVMSTPEVEKIVAEYKGRPLEVISISLDDSVEPVRDFVKSHGIVNRVALGNTSDVSEQYRVSGIPAFVLIDSKGYVAGRWDGYAPRLPLLWRKEIDRLLKS